MASPLSAHQNASLAARIRQRLVDEAAQSMTVLQATLRQQLVSLASETALLMSEQQLRREAWAVFEQQREAWLEGTLKAWREALKPAANSPISQSLGNHLELVSTESVENRMLASRMALALMEVAASEINDLRKRLKHLEPAKELSAHDIVHPEVLVLAMVEQWVACGLTLESWNLIKEVVQRHLNTQWRQIYANCNAELVAQGVLPVITSEPRYKPKPAAQSRSDYPPDTRPAQNYMPGNADPSGVSGRSNQGAPAVASQYFSGWPGAAGGQALARPGVHETDVLTRMGRLMSGNFSAQALPAAVPYAPSVPLMSALAQRSLPGSAWGGPGSDEQPLPVLMVAQVAGELQQQSAKLKKLAQNDGEKAIIELITLMFQSILQEDRIPPEIRVWFARLQMPVLAMALQDPGFFNRQDHPARLLIDHMGSCALGFDASDIKSEELATEIKRVVQVIEQYPDAGDRVYARVYEEFKEFLKNYLTQKTASQKLVGVAEQVEQKETLAIQCTIELRNLIKDMPVRDDIRDFLYKVWSEVIAVASMRQGGQHPATLALKKTATDLIWAASAKINSADRVQVIAELPELLQSLRAGMSLLGLSTELQDGHIKVISDILADAFMSRTQAIDRAQLQTLAERLAHLENYFSTEGAEELPLDAQNIENLLGIDASDLDVVTSGGAGAGPVMLAWAQNLSLGAWFSLEHHEQILQVQYVWRSPLGYLHLFSSVLGRSYLIQTARLAAYLESGMLKPQEEALLTERATREAMNQLETYPERLLG